MQIGPRIRWDSHTLANLAKNVSPALAFTPLGLGGTAALAAIGEYGRGHHSFGDLAKAAGSNVAIGAGARGIAGHYGVLGQGGSGAVEGASGATPAAPTVAPTTPPPGIGGADLPSNSDLLAKYTGSHAADAALPSAGAVTPPPVPTSPTSSPGLFSQALNFIGDHDKTSGAVLSGIGQLEANGPQNRIANAQTRLAELQAEQQQQDLERRKAQDAALEPLRQGLYGRLASIGGGA